MKVILSVWRTDRPEFRVISTLQHRCTTVLVTYRFDIAVTGDVGRKLIRNPREGYSLTHEHADNFPFCTQKSGVLVREQSMVSTQLHE